MAKAPSSPRPLRSAIHSSEPLIDTMTLNSDGENTGAIGSTSLLDVEKKGDTLHSMGSMTEKQSVSDHPLFNRDHDIMPSVLDHPMPQVSENQLDMLEGAIATITPALSIKQQQKLKDLIKEIRSIFQRMSYAEFKKTCRMKYKHIRKEFRVELDGRTAARMAVQITVEEQRNALQQQMDLVKSYRKSI